MQDRPLARQALADRSGNDVTINLRATQLADSILYVPLGGDEYYLIENREADLNGDNTVYLDRDSTTGVIQGPGLSSADPTDSLGNREWDFLLPGQGVLIWHIDDTVIFGRNMNPDFGINSNPERRGVAVEEADGIEDLGDPNSRYLFGSPFDPWFVGNYTRFGPDTSPSTRTNDGAHSHVEITIQSPPGVNMTVGIRSTWRALGWPVFTRFGLSGDPPTYGSLRHDGNRNVVASADSVILAWMSNGEPYYTPNEDGRFAVLPARDPAGALRRQPLPRERARAARIRRRGDRRGRERLRLPRPGARFDLGGPGQRMAALARLRRRRHDCSGPGRDGGRARRDERRPRFLDRGHRHDVPAPYVAPFSDTLRVGGVPVISPVVGNLAVGRFRGPAGSDIVAYALQNGTVRVVSPVGKDPSR